MRTNRDHNRPAIPASPRTPGKLSLESRRFASPKGVSFSARASLPWSGTTLSGVHCGIQKSAAVPGLDMGRTACGTHVCFCSGRFFRALLESAKSCAYGDLRAQALPERVSRSPKSSAPGTTLSGVHCGIQKSAAGNGLGMGRTACRMGVCFCSGRFFRAFLETAKSCAYGDLRAKALPERV